MKPSFWITHITVAGHPTHEDSRINLTDGLNIVCGPSNTGKSWVLQSIDYMFGATVKEFSIDEQSGYTEVRMGVHTPFGQLTLTRPIGQGHTIVDVTSTDKRISSGQYRLNKTKNGALLNSLWLRLAGFENPDELKVIKNQNYDVQNLTWRTVSHAFYADEDNITKKAPILLPEQNTAHTAAKCTLAAFITDKDYAAYAREENNETKKLRNNAIIDYLTPKPDELHQRIDTLEAALETSNPDQAQRTIDELSAQVAHVNTLIENATREGEQVASRLQEIRDQLAESGALRHRYEELASSYQAKIDRFDFVHEGHVLTSAIPAPESCPICEQTLPADKTPAAAEPDPRERQNLLTRLDGLRQTITQMETEHAPLVAEEQQLASHSRRITEHIENQLRPQLHALASSIAANNAVVAMQTELEELRERKTAIEQEIAERQAKTFPKGNFNATNEFPETFWETMSEGLLDTLGACAFPRLDRATFSRELFDGVVNGKTKSKQGKGYRSFVNTAVLLTLREYFASEAAMHSPGVLMIDTPLLGLDDPQLDPELQEARETIPIALYDFLAERQDLGQMIIVDNIKYMPDITKLQSRCNLIYFTKQESHGRYGFLEDIHDEDIIDTEEPDAQ